MKYDVVGIDHIHRVSITLLYNTSYIACCEYCENNDWVYLEGNNVYNLEIYKSSN